MLLGLIVGPIILDMFFIFECFLCILNLFLFKNFLSKDVKIKALLYASEFELEFDLNVDKSNESSKVGFCSVFNTLNILINLFLFFLNYILINFFFK